MRQLFSSLLILIFASSSFANDFGLILGARTNSADRNDTSATTVGGKTGFEAGLLGYLDLASQLQFRSGFVYVQRNYVSTNTTTSLDTTFNLAYFDIPLTLQYKFADYAGVFAGVVLALNASKSCTVSTGTCYTDGVKSSQVGYQLGVTFKFAPQLGGQFYYEMLPGTIQDPNTTLLIPGLKDGKSIGADLMFTFE